jgi:hypothetical protein
MGPCHQKKLRSVGKGDDYLRENIYQKKNHKNVWQINKNLEQDVMCGISNYMVK